jgi:hypothetical protein
MMHHDFCDVISERNHAKNHDFKSFQIIWQPHQIKIVGPNHDLHQIVMQIMIHAFLEKQRRPS